MLKAQEIINLVTSTYMWFNQIADPTQEFKHQEVAQYFSPDFVMQMNGVIKTSSFENLTRHFDKFRQSGYILKVRLPLDEIVVSEKDQKCVARYIIEKQGKPPLPHQTIQVIAIWHIDGKGKLKRMNEVVYAQDAL